MCPQGHSLQRAGWVVALEPVGQRCQLRVLASHRELRVQTETGGEGLWTECSHCGPNTGAAALLGRRLVYLFV
jgi:hypothetical protein